MMARPETSDAVAVGLCLSKSGAGGAGPGPDVSHCRCPPSVHPVHHPRASRRAVSVCRGRATRRVKANERPMQARRTRKSQCWLDAFELGPTEPARASSPERRMRKDSVPRSCFACIFDVFSAVLEFSCAKGETPTTRVEARSANTRNRKVSTKLMGVDFGTY